MDSDYDTTIPQDNWDGKSEIKAFEEKTGFSDHQTVLAAEVGLMVAGTPPADAPDLDILD